MLFLGFSLHSTPKSEENISVFRSFNSQKTIHTSPSCIQEGIQFFRLQRLTGFATVTENFKPGNKQKTSQKKGKES